MNRDDAEAWEHAVSQWQRFFQVEAYEELDSLHWWIRQHYNLPPTDERYLNLTESQIRAEYWLYVLTQRKEHAKSKGIPIASLDDLLTGATVEERADRIDAEIEKELQEEKRRQDAMNAEREVVSTWKANNG